MPRSRAQGSSSNPWGLARPRGRFRRTVRRHRSPAVSDGGAMLSAPPFPRSAYHASEIVPGTTTSGDSTEATSTEMAISTPSSATGSASASRTSARHAAQPNPASAPAMQRIAARARTNREGTSASASRSAIAQGARATRGNSASRCRNQAPQRNATTKSRMCHQRAPGVCGRRGMIAAMERGFTWIELLLVLAALGALLLMAIPSMQDGVLKRQVKDAMQLATAVEPAVQATYAATGIMPPDNKTAGLPDPDKIVSQLVKGVNVANGAITITFGNSAHKALDGLVLTLRPAVVPDQKIVPIAWLCHDVAVPSGMQVSGDDLTNIPPKWLPVECRGSRAS